MTDLCHWPRSNPSQLHCQPPVVNMVRFQLAWDYQICENTSPRPFNHHPAQQNQNVEVILTERKVGQEKESAWILKPWQLLQQKGIWRSDIWLNFCWRFLFRARQHCGYDSRDTAHHRLSRVGPNCNVHCCAHLPREMWNVKCVMHSSTLWWNANTF